MHLSVIIPTRNRALLTASLLDSLARLNPVPWEWEVIVVDNGSTDNTADRVRHMQTELPIRIRYILEEHPGLHQGRNRGAIEALGKYLAYLDDDMVLAPAWLQGVAMLDANKADAVVGRIVPKWELPPPAWLIQMCSTGTFGLLALLDLGEKPLETSCFYGCNLFIPRQMVLDFGGFHPDGMPKDLLKFRGDGETGLWLKMKEKGKSLWYSPLAVAYHIVPKSRMTVEYLKKRAYNQGISESFTDIRMHHGLYGSTQKGVNRWRREVLNLIRHRPLMLYIRNIFSQIKARNILDRQIAQIHCEMMKSFAEGWAFHRTEIQKDSTLLEHVIRKTYVS